MLLPLRFYKSLYTLTISLVAATKGVPDVSGLMKNSPASSPREKSVLAAGAYSCIHKRTTLVTCAVVNPQDKFLAMPLHLMIIECGLLLGRLLFTLHPIGHMLTDEVITKLRERYTFARDEDDSVMTLHSFVHCCCRIVCMLGT